MRGGGVVVVVFFQVYKVETAAILPCDLYLEINSISPSRTSVSCK